MHSSAFSAKIFSLFPLHWLLCTFSLHTRNDFLCLYSYSSILISVVTRQLKYFFDGFCVNPLTISIKRHPQTELLVNVRAPARIIARRNTLAVDKKVELDQILDPAFQTALEEPAKPARIMARRNTVAVDKMERGSLEEDDGPSGPIERNTVQSVQSVLPLLNLDNRSSSVRTPCIPRSIDFSHCTEDNNASAKPAEKHSTSIKNFPFQRSSDPAPAQKFQSMVFNRSVPRTAFNPSLVLNTPFSEPNHSNETENRRSIKKLPELIPLSQTPNSITGEISTAIETDNDSENSSDTPPNLATHPNEYLKFLKKKLAKNRSFGVFSDRTNL